MIKKITQLLLLLLILTILAAVYLSYFGIKTTKFNELIKSEVKRIDNKIDIELEEVKIILNLSDYSIGLKTDNSNLIIENNKIELDNITTNFSIGSFVNKEFGIKNILISTKKNDITDVIDLVRVYQNSPQLFIIGKIIKNGNLIADINLNFDEKGEITKEYSIKGKIFDANLTLLNKQEINKINLEFEIKDKIYLIKNTEIQYEKIKLSSEKIKIDNKKKNFLVEGDIKSSENNLKNEILSIFLKKNVNELDVSNIKFSSNNIFSFKINKKFKISDTKINSKINLVKLIYKPKNLKLKKYFPNYDGAIEFSNNNVQLSFNNKKLTVQTKGKFTIGKNSDEINLQFIKKDEQYDIKSKIKLNNNPISIKFLKYKKEENKNSSLNIEILAKKIKIY